MKKISIVVVVMFVSIFIFFKLYYNYEKNLPIAQINSEKKEIGVDAGVLNDYENFQGHSINLPDGWVLYKNETLGFQLEYPGGEFTYGVLKPYENKFTNDPSKTAIQKKLFYNIFFSDGDSSKIMITIEKSEMQDVDEWFKKEMAQYKINELGELFYKKIKISGQEAVLTYHMQYDPSYVVPDDQLIKSVAVIKNGLLIKISTAYINQEERNRIWGSFKFLD